MSNNKKQESYTLYFVLLIINFLFIIPWLVIAGFLPYDPKVMWPDVIALTPFFSYPLLVAISAVTTRIVWNYKKYYLALLLSFIPLVISFVWLCIMYAVVGFLG